MRRTGSDYDVTDAAGDVGAALDAGLTLAEPAALSPQDGPVYVARPEGVRGHIVDLEIFEPRPRRKRGVVELQTVDDFASYVLRHDDPTSTTIWCDVYKHQLEAVINGHAGVGDDRPGWGDHRAVLKLLLTPEWKHWKLLDGQLVDQLRFAEHIEDGLDDITDPPSADMLEIAQTISGTRTVDFRAARRVGDGTVGVEWVEEQTARAGQKGDLQIPERFTLAIAPFLGEEPYKVEARLRWRMRDGKLALGYKLTRPDLILRDAIDQIANRLSARFPGDRVFTGAPMPTSPLEALDLDALNAI